MYLHTARQTDATMTTQYNVCFGHTVCTITTSTSIYKRVQNITYNPDPADLLHEEGGDDVAGQHGQTAQEADQVNENVVLLNSVQVAAMFVVLKGDILHLAVDELLLPQVYRVQGDHET